MSFSITLQKNSSPLNQIGKTITDIVTLSGTLKDPSAIINPEIVVETTAANIKSSNYLTISEFGRKYFIDEVVSVRNNLWKITAHVDVLDSFKSEILSNKAVVSRQENDFNLLLNDGVFKCQQNPRFYYREFPSGLGNFNFILITQGGPGNGN